MPAPFFDRYRMDELVVAFDYERVCNFNWKIAVETFIECYHQYRRPCPLGGTQQPRPAQLRDRAAPWLDRVLRPAPAGAADLGEDQVGPAAVRGADRRVDPPRRIVRDLPGDPADDQRRRIHWTTVLPLSVDKCLWVRRVLVRKEARDLPDFAEIVARLKAGSLRIFEEDVAVNDMQQIGAASTGAAVGRLSHLELPVQQFNDYVRSRLCHQ